MRHLMHAFVTTSLLLSGLTANAQFRPRVEERFDRDPGRDYARLMDRIRTDLDRAEASTLPFTAGRIRVDRALEQVNAFQRRMNAGDYDRGDLDDAIVALQRVADSNRNLSVYERDDLASDVSRMRDYQAYLDGR
jgi:hypothetical protein